MASPSSSRSVPAESTTQVRSSRDSTGVAGEMETVGVGGGVLSTVTKSDAISAPSEVPSFGVTMQTTRSPLAKWFGPRVLSCWSSRVTPLEA